MLRLAALLLLLVLPAPWPAAADPTAADPHLPAAPAEVQRRLAEEDFSIVAARAARGIKEDVALRADVRFVDGTTWRVKLRRAAPGGSAFNNEPRLELAAWRLQGLLFAEDEYVVPPTALRALPLTLLQPHAAAAAPTFGGSDVVVVVQAWLDGVEGPAQTFDAARAASDALYRRRAGQLNLLTYLIRHGDSNAGNILIAAPDRAPRFFAVDNGIAFGSPDSDRGTAWRELRVDALPADAIERLRRLDRATLGRELTVLAEWRRDGGRLIAVAPGAPFRPTLGVRRSGERVQLGLTRREINDLDRRRRVLLERIDAGRIALE